MDVVQIINTLGVPIGVMLVMGYGIWQFFRWAAPRADKMIDATQQTMDRIAISTETSAEALETLVPISQTSAKAIEGLVAEHVETVAKISEIHHDVKEIKKTVSSE